MVQRVSENVNRRQFRCVHLSLEEQLRQIKLVHIRSATRLIDSIQYLSFVQVALSVTVWWYRAACSVTHSLCVCFLQNKHDLQKSRENGLAKLTACMLIRKAAPELCTLHFKLQIWVNQSS